MKALLADDHPLMREGVRQVLIQLDPEMEIVDAHDYPSLFERTAEHLDLDLALVDLNMPGVSGALGIAEFRARFPEIPLVVLSASESPHDVRRVLDSGALGYIYKAMPSADMLVALNKVLNGDVFVPALDADSRIAPSTAQQDVSGLTGRQLTVLRLLLEGHSNKSIGYQLNLSEATVKTHISGILRALGVSNRTEAVLLVQRMGWFDNAPSGH
jgi:DNA-binding NarL/FixJ family response regulator